MKTTIDTEVLEQAIEALGIDSLQGFRDSIADKLRSALAAQPTAPVVPQWQPVPIDATTDMLAAAERILDKKNWDYIDDAVWKAMLSAAPKQE